MDEAKQATKAAQTAYDKAVKGLTEAQAKLEQDNKKKQEAAELVKKEEASRKDSQTAVLAASRTADRQMASTGVDASLVTLALFAFGTAGVGLREVSRRRETVTARHSGR